MAPTDTAAVVTGFFTQLMPRVAERRVITFVSKADAEAYTLSPPLIDRIMRAAGYATTAYAAKLLV